MGTEVSSTGTEDGPTLSLAERDRRWALTRQLMDRLGLEVLLLGGFRSRDQYEHYLSNDYVEGLVVFPATGDPVTLSWTDTRVYRAMESFARGAAQWIDEYRADLSGPQVAELVRGFSTKGKVGIVGLDARTAGEMNGFIPARFWMDLTAALGDRVPVDVSSEFNEMMLPKSDEELALVEYAAQAAEAAGQAMFDLVGPGVSESEVYAAILSDVYSRGCNVRYPTLIMHSGRRNLSWGPPRWTTTAEPRRRLTDQDIIQAEIFPTYGNLEAQVQMSVVTGEPDADMVRCAEVARASYEAGIGVLRAGVTFGELVRAMEGPLVESGCWALTPLVHTVNPQSYIGITRVNRDKAPALSSTPPRRDGRPPAAGKELVLPAGTTLAFEPNACIGRTRINIGGAVTVTETGCLEMNKLPNQMNVKGR